MKLAEGKRINTGWNNSLDRSQDLYDWFKSDEELRNYHMKLLRSTEGREGLSEREAGEMVDTMF